MTNTKKNTRLAIMIVSVLLESCHLNDAIENNAKHLKGLDGADWNAVRDHFLSLGAIKA